MREIAFCVKVIRSSVELAVGEKVKDEFSNNIVDKYFGSIFVRILHCCGVKGDEAMNGVKSKRRGGQRSV